MDNQDYGFSFLQDDLTYDGDNNADKIVGSGEDNVNGYCGKKRTDVNKNMKIILQQFDCEMNGNGTQWTLIQDLVLDECKQKCSLTANVILNAKYNGFNYVYTSDVGFTLQLINKFFVCSIQDLRLICRFGSQANTAYSFVLEKTNNDEFKSVNYKINESLLGHCASRKVYIELFYSIVSKESLVIDMQRLLSGEEHSDLKLVAKNSTFNVHKGILSVRSDVFNKMLSTNMQEKHTSEIKLVEWDCIVVKELLHYIYTNSCDLHKDAHNLFRLAHFLQMTELQDLCTSYLESNINEQNIVSTLCLSDESQYELNDLKIKAKEFVESNISRLVNQSSFLEYLIDSISLESIAWILKIAHCFKKDIVLEHAVKFVKENHKSVLETEDCNKLFLNQPDLLLKVFQCTLEDNKNF